MKTPTTLARCVITGFAAVTLILSFSSCRTTQGLGQDIKHVGAKIENEASKH